VEHAARCLQIRLEKDATQKRPEESLDDRRRKSGILQCLKRRGLGFVEPILQRTLQHPGAQSCHARLIPKRTDGREQRAESLKGPTPRVGQAVEGEALAHQRSGLESPQVQSLVIQQPFRFRVGGQKHLKAAIQLESVDAIRADPAANAVRSLEDQEAKPRLLDASSAAEPGKTSTNNQHVEDHVYLSACPHGIDPFHSSIARSLSVSHVPDSMSRRVVS
jgi:hypothetical protein